MSDLKERLKIAINAGSRVSENALAEIERLEAKVAKLEAAIKDHFDRQPALNTDDPLYLALANSEADCDERNPQEDE